MNKIHRMFAIAAAAAMMMAPAVGSASALDSAGLRANAAAQSATQQQLAAASMTRAQKVAIVKSLKSRSVTASNPISRMACQLNAGIYTLDTPVITIVDTRLISKRYNYFISVTRKSDFGNGRGLTIGSFQHWGKIYVNGRAVSLPRLPASSQGNSNLYRYIANRPVSSIGTGINTYVYDSAVGGSGAKYTFIGEETCIVKY